jgi:tetratricopeptide (TPR) repeat protein
MIVALMFQLTDSEMTAKRLDKLKNKIDSNYYTADIQLYKTILRELDSIKTNGEQNWRIYYYAGFISLQLGKIYREEDSAVAVGFLEKAITDLEYAYGLYEQAEFLVLLSSAYGKLASLSFFKALKYGGDSKDYMLKAQKMADSSMIDRINLVEATHLMFIPQMFGGDKAQAEKLLLDALRLKTAVKDDLLNWAENAEIYAYLSQLEFEKENFSKAASYSRQALALEPQYYFVLQELQPQIENSGE